MCTLVGEGIRAFIVIGREHPLVGLKVFSFRNLLEAYFTGSFPYGNPLDSTKRGEQVISLYTQYVGGKQTLISTVSL